MCALYGCSWEIPWKLNGLFSSGALVFVKKKTELGSKSIKRMENYKPDLTKQLSFPSFLVHDVQPAKKLFFYSWVHAFSHLSTVFWVLILSATLHNCDISHGCWIFTRFSGRNMLAGSISAFFHTCMFRHNCAFVSCGALIRLVSSLCLWWQRCLVFTLWSGCVAGLAGPHSHAAFGVVGYYIYGTCSTVFDIIPLMLIDSICWIIIYLQMDGLL